FSCGTKHRRLWKLSTSTAELARRLLFCFIMLGMIALIKDFALYLKIILFFDMIEDKEYWNLSASEGVHLMICYAIFFVEGRIISLVLPRFLALEIAVNMYIVVPL
ncbi:hypothetical protein ACJX0J_025416, partial [Zea mays]